MSWIAILLIHGVLATALLGTITHQAVSVLWSPPVGGFIRRYANVKAAVFTNATVVLFLAQFTLGGWLYTRYRYQTRPILEDMGARGYVTAFEFKEHILSIALFTLPAYWVLWRRVPMEQQRKTRCALTMILTGCIWASFLIGHAVNNARGITG